MYEIPENLKRLYRHWPKHTEKHKEKTADIVLDAGVLKEMGAFIKKRMDIWNAKSSGAQRPFSSDPILNDYRFCNIYRELDKQTIEIHTALSGIRNDFPLWLLNVAFYRFVCNPATISKTGLLNFDDKNNREVYDRLVSLPRPKFGSAYVFPISVIQKSEYPTREKFFCFYLPKAIPKIADCIQKQKDASIAELLGHVLSLFGFNFRFHWTEILIDTAYQYPEHIDLYKKFPIGPGSEPTMKLLNPTENPEDVAVALVSHKPGGFPYISYDGRPVLLSAENWEGIGCEFRKYSNLKNGLGRKRRYTASRH